MRRKPVIVGALVCSVSLVLIGLLAPVSSARQAKTSSTGQMLNQKQLYGYMVGNRAEYQRIKAQRALEAARLNPQANRPSKVAAPVAGPSWEGVFETDLAPPDTTGAMGVASYLEAINLQLALYSRAGSFQSSTRAEQMCGGSHFNWSDPQVMFDTSSQRFVGEFLNVNLNTLCVFFSKTTRPTDLTLSSWCAYNMNFGWGNLLPDYPKLGNTTDFWLFGVNKYLNFSVFEGSDVAWMTKPGPGNIQTCPLQSSFMTGRSANLLNEDMTMASTPEPAKQTDQSSTGWIVTVPDPTNDCATGSKLEIYKVTKNLNGTANIQTVGTPVAVPSYTCPPNAPQGGQHLIDTLDGRLLNAMSGADPDHGGALALWTSHAVLGGAGAQSRWYEIDVANAGLFQMGTITDANLYVFNPGVSSDRAAGGTFHVFGNSMVAGFTTSGVNAFPAVQMVSKIGSNPQSGMVLIKQSPGPDEGFDCFQLGVCRWGDYAGASPEPGPPTFVQPTGKVWLTNEWDTGAINQNAATWRTWNWRATP
jgi:hypothetical protein